MLLSLTDKLTKESENLPMNRSDLDRNAYMLRGPLKKRGYMRWWHSFTGVSKDSGETRTFFIEYFIINPALGSDRPILGQHPYYKKRGMKPSYVMIKAGVYPKASGTVPSSAETFDISHEGRQLHAFYPISSLKVALNPLYMQIEDCLFSENKISGSIEVTREEAVHRFFMTDAGCIEWDLEVHKSLACHTGFFAGPLFSAINALDTFWHGEGIRTAYRGTVTLDGTVYEVSPDTCYGYADKHWGRKFNQPWLQLASCRLTSKRTGKPLKYSALAVDGCCPRILCFPLKPRLSLQLTYTGEDFTFLLAKPGRFSRSRWSVKESEKRFIWHIKAQNKRAFVKISMACKKVDMLPLLYESPDGTLSKIPLYSGGNGIGTIELYRIVPQGRQWIDTLTIENAFCEYQSKI